MMDAISWRGIKAVVLLKGVGRLLESKEMCRNGMSNGMSMTMPNNSILVKGSIYSTRVPGGTFLHMRIVIAN
jgi:hypothetical protein